MGTEHSDQNDKGANLQDHSANQNDQDKKNDHQNPANDTIKDSKLNQNRSVSEQQNSISNLNPSGAHEYEDNINPSLQNRASEDDELEEEIASDHQLEP